MTAAARKQTASKLSLLNSKLAIFRRMHSTANILATKAEIARIEASLAR